MEGCENQFRFAVIVHLYYENLWPELLRVLSLFPPDQTDVFVTVSRENQKLIDCVEKVPHLHLFPVENRGYDVGPFFSVLNTLALDDYDLLVKLHTKRNVNEWLNDLPVFGGTWRRRLLSPFCSKKRFEKILRLFTQDPTVGMVADPLLVLDRETDIVEERIHPLVAKELENLGIASDAYSFVAGTMFIARARIFQRIQGKYQLEDFAPSSSCHGLHTLAHVMERVFGALVTAGGYRLADFQGRTARLPFRRLRHKLFLFVRGCYRFVLRREIS